MSFSFETVNRRTVSVLKSPFARSQLPWCLVSLDFGMGQFKYMERYRGCFYLLLQPQRMFLRQKSIFNRQGLLETQCLQWLILQRLRSTNAIQLESCWIRSTSQRQCCFTLDTIFTESWNDSVGRGCTSHLFHLLPSVQESPP